MALFQTLEQKFLFIRLDADKITDACNTFLNITSADMNINENIPACGSVFCKNSIILGYVFNLTSSIAYSIIIFCFF